MLELKWTNAVLPTKAGENSAVIEGRLPIEIELSRPPGRGSIFKLCPKGIKIIAATLCAKGRKIFHLQAAGFFEIVIVSNDVRTFLRSRGQCECGHGQPQKAEKSTHVHGNS